MRISLKFSIDNVQSYYFQYKVYQYCGIPLHIGMKIDTVVPVSNFNTVNHRLVYIFRQNNNFYTILIKNIQLHQIFIFHYSYNVKQEIFFFIYYTFRIYSVPRDNNQFSRITTDGFGDTRPQFSSTSVLNDRWRHPWPYSFNVCDLFFPSSRRKLVGGWLFFCGIEYR